MAAEGELVPVAAEGEGVPVAADSEQQENEENVREEGSPDSPLLLEIHPFSLPSSSSSQTSQSPSPALSHPPATQTRTQPLTLHPQPRLPDLARDALQRLAQSSSDGDRSLDDFRPVKRRRMEPEAEDSCRDEQEVRKEGGRESEREALLTAYCLCVCLVVLCPGPDLLHLLRALVQLRRPQNCLPQVWPPLRTQVHVIL